MPNRNYLNGKHKEWRITKKLKEEGWDIAQRTAGSHSPFDVIAINKLTRVIKLIQSKPNTFSKAKEEELLQENSWLNNAFRVEFVVM